MTTVDTEKLPMLWKSSSNDSLLSHHNHNGSLNKSSSRPYHHTHNLGMRQSTPVSTNGVINNNYGINNSNIIMRCCCQMINGVQRNIPKCVAALVVITLFMIVFSTQYMDSPTIAG